MKLTGIHSAPSNSFRGRPLYRIAGLLGLAIFGAGCFSQTPTELASPAEVQMALKKRGQTIYQTQCISCHNTDPRKAGSLGPDVYGSSRELLEARVVKGDYPANYKPKRQTHLMAPLPHLKNDIEAIHTYLNSK